jgi:hypothetical protein
VALRIGYWLFAFHPGSVRWSLRPRLGIYAGWRWFSVVWLGVEIARAEAST